MAQRTQILLDAEQHRLARRRAADRGISLAEYVRELVARDLERPTAQADLTAMFDLGDSGGSDIASHKADYVAEAVAAGRIRARP